MQPLHKLSPAKLSMSGPPIVVLMKEELISSFSVHLEESWSLYALLENTKSRKFGGSFLDMNISSEI